MRTPLVLAVLLFCSVAFAQNSHSDYPRHEFLLEKGWKFTRSLEKEDKNFILSDFDDSAWESVTVPHDWAIYGPFDEANDAQVVAITQNYETEASLKTGRTGGLPYTGNGWYRTVFDIPDFSDEKAVELLFDGAMSNAKVYLNGNYVGERPYGYVSFHFDVSAFINPDGRANVLAVSLENMPESSRWYPGAGLYRNVHVIVSNKTHIPIWGTRITTPEISNEKAVVKLEVSIDGVDEISTEILNQAGQVLAKSDSFKKTSKGFEQNIIIEHPELWSPENPALYYALSSVFKDGVKVDEYETRFGIRKIELIAGEGFFLNGEKRKIRGVCNHHDLGPLGAAVNEAALRYQLELLKEMGCDAIRTSHNMPAPELVKLCDELGFMMMIEPFDEWDIAKCLNGYHLYFEDWAEADMINMIHQYRSCPSVIFWSIGNEVPNQCDESGYEVAKFLVDICKREDPDRFITCGMDQVLCVLDNGLATLLDVPGFNYRVHLYEQAYEVLPQKLVLGSETASTVSTRGVYKFPMEVASDVEHPDLVCSSYDVEYCYWSNIPDLDFAMARDHEWNIGQFVWTGFDYLGEPTPYNVMPNHSSNFGIIDLASLPKDRYWLYRSIWRSDVETLHILPHWTWPGREGEITPVFVYTNYPSAELFVNRESQGIRTKSGADSPAAESNELHNFRLIWDDVVYRPGEIRVVAYDKDGKAVAEKSVRTAGEAARIELKPNKTRMCADGKDLIYIEVSIVDKDGNLCPHDGRKISFSTRGEAGQYRAAANGDPTCLELFHLPEMSLFNGKLTAIVQATEIAGEFSFTASAEGVEEATITLLSQP